MAKCIAPFPWTDKTTGEQITLPCGKCHPCLARRASGWSYRLMKEEERSSSSYFVTFTYDTDHVPITEKGFMSLRKKDMQLFYKRLRKLHPPKTVKYYTCGEYGTKGMRPHYHAVIFGVNLETLIGKRNAHLVRTGQVVLDGKEPYKCGSWKLGHITIGTVSEASVGYTLKYMMKPSRVPLHKNDDRQKEFQIQSQGLGAGHLTDGMISWHESDILNRMYIPLKDGKKIAMPRYYKNKIYTKEQRQHIGAHLSTLECEQKEVDGQQKINNFAHSELKKKTSRLKQQF